MRTKLIPLAVAVLTSMPGVAAATPGFPAALQSDLSLAYVPPCTVCHVGIPTGGTATQAFAVALKARGLAAGDNASLAAALMQMETDRVDSDSNGTFDIDQLKAGCDPSANVSLETGAACNAGEGGTDAVDTAPTATYGCGAQIAGAPLATGSVPAGLVASLALLQRLRRRRRSFSAG